MVEREEVQMSEIKKGEKMEGENSEDCVIIDSGGIEGREGVNKVNSCRPV